MSMPFLDWLLAAPMWVKAALSCFSWLVIALAIRLGFCALGGDSFWTFDPSDVITFAAMSYLLGWKHRGDL